MENIELIQKAASAISPHKLGDRLIGDVGAAVVSASGNIYLGTCIDTSGIGFCAEQSAISAMVTAGEHKIKTVVATWKDEHGDVFIISPCGHCREFMRQVNDGDENIDVILAADRIVKLSELLPYRDSWVRE